MCSVFEPPACYLFLPTNTVFMLVLMLEVQKGCNGAVDTCLQNNFSYPNFSTIGTDLNNLLTRGVRITEDVPMLFCVLNVVVSYPSTLQVVYEGGAK